MAGIKQRRMQADYLKLGTEAADPIEFMGTGFTELNENPGAQTKEKRYINDASASTTTSGYQPVYPFNADRIESEAAIAHIVEVAKLRKTGADAEAYYYQVDLEGLTGPDEFKATRARVSISISSFGAEDGEMTVEGEFGGIGDPVAGTFNTGTKTFTPTVVVGP